MRWAVLLIPLCGCFDFGADVTTCVEIGKCPGDAGRRGDAGSSPGDGGGSPGDAGSQPGSIHFRGASSNGTTSTLNTTQLPIPAPTGTDVGDLLLAIVTFMNGGGVTCTPPLAWTDFGQTQNCLAGQNYETHWYWHDADAGEATPYVFALSSSVDTAGTVAAYVGASGQPGFSSASDPLQSPFPVPSGEIPAGVATVVVLAHHHYTSGFVAWTVPAGMNPLVTEGADGLFDDAFDGPPMTFQTGALGFDGGMDPCAEIGTAVLVP